MIVVNRLLTSYTDQPTGAFMLNWSWLYREDLPKFTEKVELNIKVLTHQPVTHTIYKAYQTELIIEPRWLAPKLRPIRGFFFF